MSKQPRVIRFFGAILGLLMLVIFPLAAWQELASLASAVSGTVIGLVFFVYGVGGKKALAKVLPNAENKLLW